MYRISVYAAGRETVLSAEAGETLLDVLRRGGFAVAAPCGGNGTCGKCLVELTDGGGTRTVPACRTRAASDCRVTLALSVGGVIAAEGASDAPPPADGGSGLAAAVDLGTTTVAVELLDRASGKSLGVAAAWNAQAPYGADVVSRMQYCMEHPDGVQTLRRLAREQVTALLRSLGAKREEPTVLFVAGNTVMEHLFAGLDPSPIARAPFTPRTLFDGASGADGVACAPCVAGYVGGDITAGLLASGLAEREGAALYLDVGTNGEMALGGRDGFLCCAVACGPAFEGAGIACGMTGVDGAISHVRWDGGEPAFEVIGGTEAAGLCGSGLIDLAAALCQKGIITASGLLLGPDEADEAYRRYLTEDENGNGVFHLTPRVYLSASDVRKLQLAKAAVAAGVRVLLQKSGVALAEVGEVLLAGGFGSYLDAQSAAAIGMLPSELAARSRAVGNASLAGARLAALSDAAREQMRAIRDKCRYVELSGDRDFDREYPEQMLFYDDEEDELWN